LTEAELCPESRTAPNRYRREMRGRTRGWIRLFDAGHSIDEIAAPADVRYDAALTIVRSR